MPRKKPAPKTIMGRVFRHVIEDIEDGGYPSFGGYTATAEDKVAEIAAQFGGFSVYTNGETAYILTAAFPYPEPVTIRGKLTGTDYTRADPMLRPGRAYIQQGRVMLDARDAVVAFHKLAEAIGEKIIAK